jgi:importin-4
VENSDLDLSSQYITLLGALRPMFDVAPDASAAKLNARDNAAGAVSRLIIKNVSAVPLDQVLPVIMASLPLRNDFLENRPVFRAIFHLFKVQPTVLAPHIDHLLSVFSHVLDPSGPDQLGDEVRAELLQLIAMLNTQVPAKVQAANLVEYIN